MANSNANVFFAFSDQEQGTSDTGSGCSGVTPVTTVTVDERTGVRTETTTLNTKVDLPEDTDADVARQIVDDCLKCYDRSEISLANLTRIYKTQTQQTTKLTLSLHKVKQKARRQRGKSSNLQDALKIVADNLPDVAKCVNMDNTGPPMDLQLMRKMVADMSDAIKAMRQQCKDLEDRCNELQKRKDCAEKQRGDENLDAVLAQLRSEIDQKKAEIAEIIRTLKEAMRRVGYPVDEVKGQDECADCKRLLNNILIDVKCLCDQRLRNIRDGESLKAEIDKLNCHVKAAEKMRDKLTEECRKLLQIGEEGKKGDRCDPCNVDGVVNVVETVFQGVTTSLKGNNAKKCQLQGKIHDIRASDERRRQEIEKEKCLKGEQRKQLEAEIEELQRKNKELRDELAKAPKSPVASKCDPDMEKRLREKIAAQMAVDDGRAKKVGDKLQRDRERNENVRKILQELSQEIDEIDTQLERKRKELADAQAKLAHDKEDSREKMAKMEDDAAKLQAEIEAMERQLQDLLKRCGANKQVSCMVGTMLGYEKRLREKLDDLDRKLAEADAEKQELENSVKNAADECKKLEAALVGEDVNHDRLERELEKVQDDIDRANRALDRERKRNLERTVARVQRSQFQYQHVSTTTILSAADASATKADPEV